MQGDTNGRLFIYVLPPIERSFLMARVYPLFSSSKGNATFIGNEKGGIMIDSGVSCKMLTQALIDNGLSPEAVQGIFITHEHSDHIKGLKVFTKNFHTPVFAGEMNLDYLISADHISPNSRAEKIDIDGKPIEFAGYQISAFSTPHDTRQSNGYRIITPDQKTITICTDLGTVTENIHKNLCGSELVLFEANYDELMLKNGSYPHMLKKRIASNHGHLSNDESASEIESLVNTGTTRVILGHLSQQNNTPVKARETISNRLSGFKDGIDYILKVAPVFNEGEVVIL